MEAAMLAVLSVLDNIASLKEKQRKKERFFYTLYSFSFVKTLDWWLATK